MSGWKKEASYLGRYAGSGVLNTASGFSTIFLLMWLGLSPYLANLGGYLVGLILGFFVSRKFVFVSQGHLTGEAVRYLAAFLCCFALNLAVLKMALDLWAWHAMAAQILSTMVYTAAMYLLTRHVVFSPGGKT